MRKFLRSKEVKLSVTFAFAGFLAATLGTWVAVGLGLVPIQLPLPTTTIAVGLLLLAFWGMMIWVGVDVTREMFDNGTPSWGAILMIPVFWVCVVLSGGILTALYVGMIHFFFTVLWLV